MVDDREDVYSKAVRAGKRTYFFDVKSTRGKDLYLTITESKKHTHEDGTATYDKHKIFLYKEDFGKFVNAMHEVISHVRDEYLPDYEFRNMPELHGRYSYYVLIGVVAVVCLWLYRYLRKVRWL